MGVGLGSLLFLPAFLRVHPFGLWQFDRSGSPALYSVSNVNFVHLLDSAISLTATPKTFTNQHYTKRFRILGGDLIVSHCRFDSCDGNNRGGGSLIETCFNVSFSNCIFAFNSATFAGGLYVVKANYTAVARIAFLHNSAEYVGAFYQDGVGDVEEPTANFSDLNFTANAADEWTGAFRVEHNGGFLRNAIFDGNRAATCGALFDFSWKPAKRLLSDSLFVNNSAKFRGGAFCGFHIMHLSEFRQCGFIRNSCEKTASCIYIESTNAIVDLVACSFDQSESESIAMRFDGSEVRSDQECMFGSAVEPSVYVAAPIVSSTLDPPPTRGKR
jgi:hypothetical protein